MKIRIFIFKRFPPGNYLLCEKKIKNLTCRKLKVQKANVRFGDNEFSNVDPFWFPQGEDKFILSRILLGSRLILRGVFLCLICSHDFEGRDYLCQKNFAPRRPQNTLYLRIRIFIFEDFPFEVDFYMTEIIEFNDFCQVLRLWCNRRLWQR